MANLNTQSHVQQIIGFGVGLGLGIGQIGQGAADVLGLGLSQAPTNPPDEGMKFDPISIRITLVIVFFTIFLLVILIIFIVVCLKRHKCVSSSRNQKRIDNGKDSPTRPRPRRISARDNEGTPPRPISNESENSFMNENEDYLRGVNYTCSALEKASKKSFEPRPHQPDIIEAEIHFVPSYHLYDYAYDHRICGHPNEQIKHQVHCALPNAPDISYRVPHQPQLQSPVSYHEHQDAQEAKQRHFVNRSFGLFPHQNSPHPNNSLPVIGLPAHGNAKGEHFQSTPLARLTPSTSSESPQHPIRILTLQDISRKQLQSAGLVLESISSSGGVSKDMVHGASNSDMNWSSPVVSQLSKWSSAPKTSMESCAVKNATSLGIDMLHSVNLLVEEIPPPIQHDDCSSTTTESGDDSFTGSEFGDYDENQVSVIKKAVNQEKLLGVACPVEPVDIACSSNGGLIDGFPDSFSVLLSCEDHCAHKFSASSLQSLDYLLNWGLSFDSLMDVFQDLAELPDLEEPGRQFKKPSIPNSCEIYV